MRSANELSSMGVLISQGIFSIPAYQRDYAWAFSDIDVLAEDIFRIAGSGEPHFIGSIIVMKADHDFKATSSQGDTDQINASEEVVVYHVVDGQQRLTACSLFLCAIRELLKGENDAEFPEGPDPCSKNDLLGSIDEYLFAKKAYIGKKYAPRLFLNSDPSKQYQNCLYPESNLRARGRRLAQAYKHLIELVEEDKKNNTLSTPEYYVNLRNAITGSLKVDDVCCDTFGSAFQIFESINAKGQPLSSVDLIKCCLMQRAQDNTSDAQTRWNKLVETTGSGPDNTTDLEQFMTAFLFTEKGERIPKARAYNEFKAAFSEDAYTAIFDKLQTAAESYRQMTACSGGQWDEDDPLYAFHILKLKSIYVPLLAAARYYPGGVSDANYKRLKELLCPFAIRYQICGKGSNALDIPFKDVIAGIKSQKPADEVFAPLRRALNPSNDSFKAAFAELTFRDSEEAIATYLLKKIETSIESAKNGTNKRVPADATLEHIIPKEYTDYIAEWPNQELPDAFPVEYVRSIGNMALIGRADNSAAGNKPYSGKIEIYRNGHKGNPNSPDASFNILGKVVEDYPDAFTMDDVKTRASYLADHAVVLWE